MNSLMEKNNQFLSNQKEAQLLIRKIEIEWDFQSEQSGSEGRSLSQLPSPRRSQDGLLGKKRPRKRKKKKKAHFAKPIESEEVKRDFLSNFDLDFSNQVDKDIFVQYGEFSDYLNLFNQKFNRPEKKICKFSLERLSKKLKKELVFGDDWGLGDDQFEENESSKSGKLHKFMSLSEKGDDDDEKPDLGIESWRGLRRSLSTHQGHEYEAPPGLETFSKDPKASRFGVEPLNPYQLFIDLPAEDRKSVLNGSPKDILPNLDKSRGEAVHSDSEDLGHIISKKRANLTQRKGSGRNSFAVSINRNSFLTQGLSQDNSSLKKLNSQSTMNQTRVTDKSSSNCIRSKVDSALEKKESMDEEDKFDIYDQKMTNSEIKNIISRLHPKSKKITEKKRFSEAINYRCSLNPTNPAAQELRKLNTEEEAEDPGVQIKVNLCGSSTSNCELKPKRSIFSQMNNLSRQDCYSIGEEDHIKEEEEDETSSYSLRETLNNRVSKSSRNSSFLTPVVPKEEDPRASLKHSGSHLLPTSQKLLNIPQGTPNSQSTKKKLQKTSKKLKLNKNKKLKEYAPVRRSPSSNENAFLSPGNQPIEMKPNQTLNPHNYPEYGQTPPLPRHPQGMSNGAFPRQPMPFPAQPYMVQPQFGHYPMPQNMMPRYPPQPGVPMYQNPAYPPPMYNGFQNFPMPNLPPTGGFIQNMYLQTQPVFYNMQRYMPQPPSNPSLSSLRTKDSSNDVPSEAQSATDNPQTLDK